MVDRTVYFDKDKVPELALRQIFGRQKLPEPLCLLIADKDRLLVECMAMLGDSIASVKALKAIVSNDSKVRIGRSCTRTLVDIAHKCVPCSKSTFRLAERRWKRC